MLLVAGQHGRHGNQLQDPEVSTAEGPHPRETGDPLLPSRLATALKHP